MAKQVIADGNNVFNVSSLVGKATGFFDTSSTFLATANRNYQDMYTQKTWEAGNTVEWRIENRYFSQRGDTVAAQGIKDNTINMTIKPLYTRAVDYRPTDLDRNINDWSDRVLRPASAGIVADMNGEIGEDMIGKLFLHTTVESSLINTYAKMSAARNLMVKYGMPTDTWYAALTPDDATALKDSLANQFNTEINTPILKEATLGSLAGFTIFEEVAVPVFSSPLPAAGIVHINATVPQGAPAIVLKDLNATQIIKKGTIIEFPDHYFLRPVNQDQTNIPFSVVVTEDSVAAIGGVVTVDITPAINYKETPEVNGYKNVNAQIPINAVCKLIYQYNSNVCYTPYCLFAATPPLRKFSQKPSDTMVPFVSQQPNKPSTKSSMRMSLESSVGTNQEYWRLDSQLADTWYGEQGVLVLSNALATPIV